MAHFKNIFISKSKLTSFSLKSSRRVKKSCLSCSLLEYLDVPVLLQQVAGLLRRLAPNGLLESCHL